MKGTLGGDPSASPAKRLKAIKLIALAAGLIALGALALRPDLTTLESNLSGLASEAGRLEGDIRRLKALAAKLGARTVPPIPRVEAIYLARFLGCPTEKIRLEAGYIEFVVPHPGSGGASAAAGSTGALEVTGPALSRRIEWVRQVFKRNCAVQQLWPDLTVRAYTTE